MATKKRTTGIHKLTAAEARNAKADGRIGDGGGLWLQGGRSWVFRYTSPVKGTVRELGLGALASVSLAQAREAAAKARGQVTEGRDPISEKNAAQEAANVAAAGAVTFRDAAEAYIKSHKAAWKGSGKSEDQWRSSLATYAFPHIGATPVADVTEKGILATLRPIWEARKVETGVRVRGRIEAILDYAAVEGWRARGFNPATWKGHLKLSLAAPRKVRAVVNHAALDWREAPAFMAELAGRGGMGALALRCTILTAARSGEVRGARWGEIDMGAAVWTVPAARMKANKEHRVPLPDAAVALLRDVEPLSRGPGSLIFPGLKPGVPLSDMSLGAVLRRMNRTGITVHGFRSTFRDWAAETGKPGDVAEAALAHTLGSRVQAAYQRGDLLERRRVLMAGWASYLLRP